MPLFGLLAELAGEAHVFFGAGFTFILADFLSPLAPFGLLETSIASLTGEAPDFPVTDFTAILAVFFSFLPSSITGVDLAVWPSQKFRWNGDATVGCFGRAGGGDLGTDGILIRLSFAFCIATKP